MTIHHLDVMPHIRSFVSRSHIFRNRNVHRILIGMDGNYGENVAINITFPSEENCYVKK